MKLTIRVPMVVVILSHTVAALFYREETYEAPRISEQPVSADVWSSFPGDLVFMFTNDHVVTIKVKVTSKSEQRINNTRVTFSSDKRSFRLEVHDHLPETVAAVTGSANRHGVAVLVICFPAVLIGWKHFSLLLLLLMLCVTGGMSERPDSHSGIGDVVVKIEVRAPRYLQYRDINLFVLRGTLRVSPASEVVPMATASSLHCSTNKISDGCLGCCHGHGVCMNNNCTCDEGFDPAHSCRLKTRRDHLFSHPLDPRLSRTIFPNGDIMTLSRTPATLDRYPVRFNPAEFFMDIRWNKVSVGHIQLSFNSNGFLKKIHDTVNNNKLIFRMARTSECVVNINDVKHSSRYSVDICKNPNMRAPRAYKTYWRNSKRRKLNRSRGQIIGNDVRGNRYLSASGLTRGDDMVDVPVKIERCGDNSTAMAAVYFQLTPAYQNNNGTWIDPVSGQHYIPSNESIIMHPYSNSSSHVNYLRLPNTYVSASNSSIASKCDLVIESRVNVCKVRLLQTLKVICNNVQYENIYTAEKYYVNDTISYDLCTYAWHRLQAFCDIHSSDKLLSRSDRCSYFKEQIDLFQTSDFLVKPIAVFPDGKEVIGEQRLLSIRNASALTNTAIIIKDERPEFKIVKISVIPRDPVPLDIYQVRMDYTCATNHTVISMNVTGSDFYKNHAICNGITACHCCILHAAGAKDATVDRVKIRITDPLTHIDISKEMVVIF